MDKVIFLDRDGTINEEVHYLHRPEDLRILPGAAEAIRLMNEAGYRTVVVTNQAGVARGYYTCEDVEELHRCLNRMLEAEGGHIDRFYFCPHHPEFGIGEYRKACRCRKPGIGMFEMAERDISVDRAHSYMIGDKRLDVQAGKNYGVTSILVGTGYGAGLKEEAERNGETPFYDHYAENLLEAARYIIQRENDMTEQEYLNDLIRRYPVLEPLKTDIYGAYEKIRDCFAAGHKLLIAGNGGSAADSEHIAGELMKGFVKNRPVPEDMAEKLKAADPDEGARLAENLQGGLPTIALTGHPGLSTAFLNDIDGRMIFAQQVYGYGTAGDVFLGISTSGNSENVYLAAVAAKARGMAVVVLSGKGGGRLKKIADVSIVIPDEETYRIQELHLPVYHTLCLMLEEHFFAS